MFGQDKKVSQAKDPEKHKQEKGEEGKKEQVEEKSRLENAVPFRSSGKISVSLYGEPAVLLSSKAFTQLFAYASATSFEISCLGAVKREGDIFVVEEFFLVEQTGSFAHTEIDEEALASLFERLRKEGREEAVRSLRCWAHTHPGMEAFWSHTDDKTCQILLSDYLVSLVVGKGFQVRARLDLGGSMRLSLDNLPVYWEMTKESDEWRSAAAELKAKLKEERFIPLTKLELKANDEKPEAEDYCEMCGNWHSKGKCPLNKSPGVEEEEYPYPFYEDYYLGL